MYFPDIILFSYDKKTALNLLLALFRTTALPTFFEVTNAMFKFSSGLKKATKEGVCHFLPLLYIRLKSLELFSLNCLFKQLIFFYL